MIEVFLQTGMRLSELAQLTLSDIELPKRITRDIESMGSVRVLRKGGKVERIPLNYKACHALATYLKVRPKVEHTGSVRDEVQDADDGASGQIHGP